MWVKTLPEGRQPPPPHPTFPSNASVSKRRPETVAKSAKKKKNTTKLMTCPKIEPSSFHMTSVWGAICCIANSENMQSIGNVQIRTKTTCRLIREKQGKHRDGKIHWPHYHFPKTKYYFFPVPTSQKIRFLIRDCAHGGARNHQQPPCGLLTISTNISITHMFAFNTTQPRMNYTCCF